MGWKVSDRVSGDPPILMASSFNNFATKYTSTTKALSLRKTNYLERRQTKRDFVHRIGLDWTASIRDRCVYDNFTGILTLPSIVLDFLQIYMWSRFLGWSTRTPLRIHG